MFWLFRGEGTDHTADQCSDTGADRHADGQICSRAKSTALASTHAGADSKARKGADTRPDKGAFSRALSAGVRLSAA